MESLDPYLDKFSDSGKRVLEGALKETRRRNQHSILPEHILYALAETKADFFSSTMRNLAIDPDAVRLAIERRLQNSPQHAGEGFRIAPETMEIFKHSMDRARSQNRRVIEAGDILYVLTTDKLDLLNDILRNPDQTSSWRGSKARLPNDISQNADNPDYGLNSNKISALDKQNQFFSQLQDKPSDFFIHFSLGELVKNNNSPSGILCAKRSMGGVGFGMSGIGGLLSGGDVTQTSNITHESFSCSIEPSYSDKFDEAQFISSLEKDIEDNLNKNRLKITRTENPNSSSFLFEYRKGKIKGRVEISGEMKNGYYELKAMISEKSNRKSE